MKQRPVDTTKKSNIKCEHCQHWSKWPSCKCSVKGTETHYYQRCKQFQWRSDLVNKK